MVIRFFLRASGFNFSRRGAKMPLDFSFFLLRGFFSENILVFCVRLRKVIEAEPLRELQLAAALRVALDHHVYAPLDFRGRALPAASEILVVLNLELSNIFFECSQLFFDGRHEWEIPSNLHARCEEQNRQPDARAAVRIRYGALRRDSNEVPRLLATETGCGLMQDARKVAQHCSTLRGVLKCSGEGAGSKGRRDSNGTAREENGFGGAKRTLAADSVGGRIAGPRAAGGTLETRGPQLGRRSCARGACGFEGANRGRFELDGHPSGRGLR